MRRKLIKQEAFEDIKKSSALKAEHELVEAQDVLAKALGKDHLSLHCFNESTVLYETLDDSFIHAVYSFDNGFVKLEHIEELVIDSDSVVEKRKEILSDMLEAVINDQRDRADSFLQQYMNSYSWNEAKKTVVKMKGNPDDHEFDAVDVEDKPKKTGKLVDKMPPFAKRKAEKSRKEKEKFSEGAKGRNSKDFKDAFKKKLKAAGKKVEEAYNTASEVLNYVDFMRVGPALAESQALQDDNGNVVAVRLPGSHLRNEGKMLAFDWKTLNSKVKTLRESALSLHENQAFAKTVLEMKKQLGLSQDDKLESTVEDLLKQFPNVLYVTQNELAQMIGESLRYMNVTNFDDERCQFLAEGVLRSACDAMPEKVSQIMHLASAPKCESNEDAYDHFQKIVEEFYPYVDSKFQLEQQVYVDLYETLEGLYRTADRRNDEDLKNATAGYLNELADVLNGRVKPDLELAEDAAGWLKSLIETNLESGKWTVSNTPHVTLTGEHPEMASKAQKSYSPSADFSGDWGDALPMVGQDNMKYKGGKFAKEARSNSWGNLKAGGETYPTLKNKYVPTPFGTYTMKGDKGVDKEAFGQHWATWQSGDTWPNLHNPVHPKAETPKTYKMNHGKDSDLVVDK